MALFKKEEEENINIETNNTELDNINMEKLIERINNLKYLNNLDLRNKIHEYFKLHYLNGLSIDDCIFVLDTIKKYDIYTERVNLILDMYMLINNKIVFEKLLSLDKFNNSTSMPKIIDYIQCSRAYYVDVEAWYARIRSVIESDENLVEALEEDKMRVGVYPSISLSSLNEMLDIANGFKDKMEEIKKDIKTSKANLDSMDKNIENICQKATDKIESISKTAMQDMDKKQKEILQTINRALNLNPSSKKELLKEIQNQYDVLPAFDEKVDIAARYNKLLENKNPDIIYHPKFDDVLKYILAGNTVCLDGPAKCGKTELVKSLAILLNTSFSNLGNIYDEVSQIDGYYDFNTNYNKPTFQDRFENGGIVLMKNINTAPIQATYSLNNIINSFSYNPYIFGDKKVTTPNKNFRLIMTNNNASINGNQIDNLVTVKMDYDTNFESSLTDDKELIEFLSELRKNNANITTSTFIDFTTHLKLKLFPDEKIIEDYIVSNNSSDLLKNISSNINQDNKYTKALKLVLTK